MRDPRAATRAVGGLPVLVALVALVTGAGTGLARAEQPAAAGPTAASQTRPTDPEPEGLGAFLYGRDCTGCHGPEGGGTPRGVSIADAGEALAHYALVTGRMPIREPDEIPERGPSRYTDEEIDALVDHVAGFGDGPALPDVDWRSADVADGGELYRLHCGACHSSTGIGGALAYERIAPPLMSSEPSTVAAAVVGGPGAMPAFAPQGFTDQELADLVAYVQELRSPEDRGGWPIFRAGRADEALVTWVLAVPLVLVTLGWIARRAR